MTVRELIIELVKQDNQDAEVKLYSLVHMDNIDTGLSQFEFVSDNIDYDDSQGIVYIEGIY